MMPLVIDLEKGRKLGSQNDFHLYIMRIDFPSPDPNKPRYKYVYPPLFMVDVEKTEATKQVITDPKTGKKTVRHTLIFKEGYSLKDAVNFKLFGYARPKKRFDKEIGHEIDDVELKDGIFVEYEKVPYGVETITNPYSVKPEQPIVGPSRKPVSEDKIGKYRILRHPKVLGYTKITWGDSVAGYISSKDYVVPKKLTDLEVKPEDIAREDLAGGTVEEGAVKPELVLGKEQLRQPSPVPVVARESALLGDANAEAKPVPKPAAEALPDLKPNDKIKLPDRGWVTFVRFENDQRSMLLRRKSRTFNANVSRYSWRQTRQGNWIATQIAVEPAQAHGAATAPEGEIGPRVYINNADEEAQLYPVGEVGEEIDPVALARKFLVERKLPKAKRKRRKKGGARYIEGDYTITGLRPEQIAQYSSEKELAEEMQTRPLTTLLSLGEVKPSQVTRSPVLQTRLVAEWMTYILRRARDDFDAYKVTNLYDEMMRRDLADKIDPLNNPESRTHKLYTKFRSTMVSAGQTKLLELLRQWEPNLNPRFDLYAREWVKRHMMRASKENAEHHGVSMEIVSPEDFDEATRRSGAGVGQIGVLSPEEQYELNAYTDKARSTLLGLINNDKEMPDTLRRTLLYALWLDPEGMKEEARSMKDEKAAREAEAIKQTSDAPLRRRATGGILSFMRPYTGKGSIVSKLTKRHVVNAKTGVREVVYDTVEDPFNPGNHLDIRKLHRDTQAKMIERWYLEAVRRIAHQISVPISRAKPTMDHERADVKEVERPKQAKEHKFEYVPEAEWKNKANWINVPKAHVDKTIDEILTEHLLGNLEGSEEPRVLTQAGRMLRRWLELESKLSATNKRGVDRYGGSRRVGLAEAYRGKVPQAIQEKLPAGEVSVETPQHVEHYISMEKLGRKWEKEPANIGHRYVVTPAVPVTTFHPPMSAPVAIQSPAPGQPPVHPAIEFFSQSPNQKLAKLLGIDFGKVGLPSSTGVYATPNISIGTVASNTLGRAERFYNQSRYYQGLTKKELEAISDQAHAQLKGLKHTDLESFHQAATAYQDALNRKKMGADQKDEVKALGEDYARLAAHVEKFRPGMARLYREMLRNETPIDSGILAEHKDIHERSVRAAQDTLHVIDHERRRRGFIKSLCLPVATAHDLVKAFMDYRHAQNRVLAALEE